jgi:pyruvate dehydrogenase complex dehydrogenase (E1) component
LVLSRNTPYINTISPEAEVKSKGDQKIERRIRSLIRWNAAAMVVRANKKFPELGGHIGTFAGAAFHLINDLILLSIFWSPLDFTSASGDIVFM